MNGQLMIRGTNEVQSVDFGTVTVNPLVPVMTGCNGRYPAIIFGRIFRLVQYWGWDALSDDYKENPYLCADFSALNSKCNIFPTISDVVVFPEQKDNTDLPPDSIPTTKVSMVVGK